MEAIFKIAVDIKQLNNYDVVYYDNIIYNDAKKITSIIINRFNINQDITDSQYVGELLEISGRRSSRYIILIRKKMIKAETYIHLYPYTHSNAINETNKNNIIKILQNYIQLTNIEGKPQEYFLNVKLDNAWPDIVSDEDLFNTRIYINNIIITWMTDITVYLSNYIRVEKTRHLLKLERPVKEILLK